MNRCPICSGRVDLAINRCVRCDSDLSQLIMIESTVDQYCRIAIQVMLKGDLDKARLLAQQAVGLKRTPFTKSLLQFLVSQSHSLLKNSFVTC